MKRLNRYEKRGKTPPAQRHASWGKALISALLVVTMSTMSYSPAIAVAASSSASAPAFAAAADEATATDAAASASGTTDNATEQSDESAQADQPADPESQQDPAASGESAQSQESSSQSSSSADASSSSASASSSSASSGSSAASSSSASAAAETTKTIERTLASTSGGRYTVKVAYDANAGIPDGSTISIVEYTQEPSDPNWRSDPAYKDRPLATERFVSKDYLAQRTTVAGKGLGMQDTDYAFFSKFLNVAIVHNGQEIALQAAVQVTIETTAVDVTCSDGLGLARLAHDEALAGNEQALKEGLVSSDGKSAKPLGADNLTYDKDAKTNRSAADDKVVKLQCSTKELGELAVVGVAVPRATLWQEDGAMAQVLGPATQGAYPYEIDAAGLEDGEELLGAYAFSTDPARDYGTMLWARVVAADGKSAAPAKAASGLVGYQVQGGAMVGNPTAFGTAAGVLAFKAQDGVALLRDASAAAQAASTQAASADAPATGYVNGNGVLQRTLPAANGGTYTVRVSYGAESGVPQGATLQVRELSSPEAQQHRAGAAEAIGASQATSMRFLDLSILDAAGRKVTPAGDVSVSIMLADTVVSGNPNVVHFGADGPELVTLDQGAQHAGATAAGRDHLLSFTTDSFSVYAVVYAAEASPVAGAPATELEEGVGYYLSVGDAGNRRYVNNTIFNAANPNGLGKMSASVPEYAPQFFFERADAEGDYYVYTHIDGEPYYLYMEYFSDNEGHVRLAPTKTATLHVTQYSASNGQYLIAGSDRDKTWYLNQHRGTGGVCFAGWKDGGNDVGSRITLTKVEKDPLGLDGQEYALVNQDAHAISATTIPADKRVQGLTSVSVSKTTDSADGKTYYRTLDSADQLSLWRFAAQDGGTYYLSTVLNGKQRYLNIDVAPGNDKGAAITVSATPQPLVVGLIDGNKIAVSARGFAYNAMLNYYGTEAGSTERFAAWAKNNVTNAAANERFALGTPGPGMIVYRYADPPTTEENADDDFEHTVVDEFAHDEWAAGYRTRAYTLKSYSAETRYIYSVDHWVGSDGQEYDVDAEIATEPAEALYLTPVWKLDEATDRVVTLSYYNELFSKTDPADVEDVRFGNGEELEYQLISTVNDFYVQSEGKMYHTAGSWLTESGVEVEPNAGPIDLTDFQYFADGNYESIRLVAQWQTRVDPWNIDGKGFVLINDRFDASGYTPDARYQAIKAAAKTSGNIKGLDKQTVIYNTSDKTCTSTSEAPSLWMFEAQEDGTYTVKDSATGQYLYITDGNNVGVSATAQHIDVRYIYDNDRYVLMKNGQNVEMKYEHNGGNGLFRGATWKYSDAKNQKDVRLIFAPLKSSVVYYYDAYTGADAHPTDAATNLPETVIEDWAAGYKVKEPLQDTYQADDGTFLWNYRFSHWRTADGTRVNPDTSVVYDPSPALGLHAVWDFVSREYAPITVTYTVQRASNSSHNDERLVDNTKLPAVDGLIMVPGAGDIRVRSYTGEETVSGSTVAAYGIKGLTDDAYTTINGKKYKFVGWQVGGGDEATTVNAGDTINLSDLDTNGDHAVSLSTLWTENFKDPWGIDGKSYLVVYNNNRAMSATLDATTIVGEEGMKVYGVKKPSGETMPLYQVSNTADSHVMWQFDAQDDGSYVLSTTVDGTRQYLVATLAPEANKAGGLHLSGDESAATQFRVNKKADGTYCIWRMGDNNVKSMLDVRGGNAGPFSMWGKKTGEYGQWFNLGLPDTGVVVYQYPPYAGTYPEGVEAPPADAKTDLPQSTMEYCEATTFTVADPAQAVYTARDSLHKWVYMFVNWQGAGGPFTPGHSAVSPSGVQKLDANWAFVSKTDVSKTVHYSLELSGEPLSEPALSKLGLVNNAEVVPAEDVHNYAVCSVDPGYYRTVVRNVCHTYEFVGWEDESGNTISASSHIDVSQAAYDADGDDVINLKAKWSNHYADSDTSHTREVRFYVSVKALSADAFNDNASISTQGGDFTKEIHYSLMQPASVTSPLEQGKVTTHPELDNQNCYPVVNYFNETETYKNTVTIAEADKRIRSMAETGYYVEADNQTYQLLDMPTDDEVLEALKKGDCLKPGSSLTLDGVKVDPEQINSENFTIRWYVCKYQTDAGCWCWHIDGKLTPNLSYLKVEKTFGGEEDALAHIPANFTINVSNATQSESGIVSTDKMMNLNLVLNDQTGSTDGKYGLIDGTPTSGTYGYTGREGDAYTWLIPVARGGVYDIIEKNYSITTPTASYGVAAQYSVTETQGDVSGATRTPWFGTVTGYSASYPRTSIDVKNTSNIQSVNLYNTYVETGTFVIQKVDVGIDGLQDIAMPGVKFAVHQFDENGVAHPVAITQQRRGVDGRYNVDLYGAGEVSNIVTTGADGNIYLKMKKADGVEHEVDDGAIYTFTFTELNGAGNPGVADGYLERADGQAPTFTMYVDANGNFQVDETPGKLVEPEGGHITLLKAGGPEVAEEDAYTIGATVTNKPRQLSVTAKKDWRSAHVQNSVTVQLTGRTNGVTRISDQAVLDATMRDPSEGPWSHTWDALPMMWGNRKVNYTITETKIGPYAAGTTTFSENWSQRYDYEYYNGAGEAANDYTTERIIATVTNTDPVTNARRVVLQKVDAGYTSLGGAVFTLHRGYGADSAVATDSAGNALSNLVSGANGTIWLGEIAEGIYYLHESAPQNRWFALVIDENGVTCTSV